MTQPAHDEPATVLDPGRTRPEDGDLTLLDPGRTRPVGGGPGFPEGLPPGLDARFVVVRRLDRGGAEADLHLVQERATGAELVLKLYRGTGADQRVRTFLAGRESRHIVTVLETGTTGGRGYEIQEHLAGGNLAELRRAHPAGLTAEVLTGLVGQVAEGLAEMHANHLVHRDVKPANVLVRRLAPLEVALIDFGLVMYAPEETTAADGSGTVRYMPPEYISGQMVSPAFDWWSLGMTVLELATGAPFLEGLDDTMLRIAVTGGPIGTQSVVDPRLRLLCRGLLAQQMDERWGAAEVTRWLGGESPEVPAGYAVPPGAAEAEVENAYTFADTGYRNRTLLAAAMTAGWEHTARLLYGTDPEPLRTLRDWLRQFPGGEHPDDPGEPPDVRLLRLLRSMAPALPPIHRGVNIAPGTLPELARSAVENTGNRPEIVRDLWRHRLLPLLATAPAAPDLAGGDGLDRLDREWRQRVARWSRMAAGIDDPGARAVLESTDRAVRARMTARLRALSLSAVTADDVAVAELRRTVRSEARRFRLSWFTRLAQDPEGMWLALLLREHAETRAEQEMVAARRRAWLSRNRRFREWSRRQNRPVALSWAVAGVFLMVSVCALVTGVSDLTGIASDAAVLDAWVATAFAAVAALTVETVLAWEIGGRFHPRYSTLGTAFTALGRAAGSLAGRGLAMAVFALVAVAVALTAHLPVISPLAAAAGIIGWAVPRYMRWHSDQERERAEADRGARELLANRTA
jgi:serine/threonine protein kinase